MKTLPDDLYDTIMSNMDNGDNSMEAESYNEASTFYQQALAKVPESKHDWEISLHIYTALGDVSFNLKDFESAIYYYNQALQCPEGTGAGYVWLGLGQAYFEVNEIDKSKEALLRAYMLEGDEIFEGVNRQYFRLIEEIV
jgi:tetratricopeptide (TPR) repeat protein